MATHTLEISRNDQTEDVLYFCSIGCMAPSLWTVAGVRGEARWTAGERQGKNGTAYRWGRSESNTTDYDVWCEGTHCGDFMWHGMNCECEDDETPREPLTARQMKMRG